MKNKTLKCKCGSEDIKNLEPEKMKLYESITTIIEFKCKKCGKNFKKRVITEFGKKNL